MKLQDITKKRISLSKELFANLFRNPDLTPKVVARLSKEDFGQFSKTFEVFADSYKENKNLITELVDNHIITSEFLEYGTFRKIEKICEEIKNVSNTIKIYAILENTLNEIEPEHIDQFVADFQRKLTLGITSKEVEQSSIDSVIADYKERQQFYKDKFKNGGGIIGVSTGYEKIDEIIDGFRPEHLWIVGGYTNMGKTFCSLNFASNLVKQGKRVVYYSLEMSKTDILSRLLGIMTKQNGLTILKGFQHNEEEVENALKLLKDSNFSIYNEKTDIATLTNSMVEENINKPVDLFIVDFIQLVNVKGAKSEYETITTSVLELQQTARRLKIPIMALSQISNDGARTNNEQVMSFKGSGAIASSADFAIEINVEDIKDYKEKIAQRLPVNMIWNIRKNRHGKIGSLDMTFDGNTGIFKVGESF